MNSEPSREPEVMTVAERVHLLKYASALLAIPSVVGVAAPYIDVYVPDGWHWLSIPVVVALIVAAIRGVHSLAFPIVRAANPYAVSLGAAAAIALLLAAPESIRLALVNFSLRPVWIFASAGGALLAVLYLWLALKSRAAGQPPNKSLERTREG
jgi:hypothetical protein